MKTIQAQPLTPQAFAPFGDLLDTQITEPIMINNGNCERFHDLGKLNFKNGRAGVSLFLAKPRNFPYVLDLVERHPLGSQAFIPMSEKPFLVTVAPDENGTPGLPRAFVTAPGQGINFHIGTWHGVLTPLHEPGLFAVIDRIGPGNNLEEFPFPNPYNIVHP